MNRDGLFQDNILLKLNRLKLLPLTKRFKKRNGNAYFFMEIKCIEAKIKHCSQLNFKRMPSAYRSFFGAFLTTHK